MKALKVLAINSSLRGKKGVSAYIIEKIFSGARDCNANCELIHLVDYNIKHCTACNQCQNNHVSSQCVFEKADDVEFIFQKIRAADIIIYATPVYVFTISSLLKTLLERTFYTSKVDSITLTNTGLFFHDIDRAISSKPFLALILCDNIEERTIKNAVSFFKTYSKFTESKRLGILIRKSAGLYKTNTQDLKKNKRIQEISCAYREVGRELAKRGTVSRKTLRIANQEIIHVPKVIKALLKVKFFRNAFDMDAKIRSERFK